jgi:hypothetical protein
MIRYSLRRAFIAVLAPIILGGIFALVPFLTILLHPYEPDHTANARVELLEHAAFMESFLVYEHLLLSLHDAFITASDSDKVSRLLEQFDVASNNVQAHTPDPHHASIQAQRFYVALLAEIWFGELKHKDSASLPSDLAQIQKILTALHATSHTLQRSLLSPSSTSLSTALTEHLQAMAVTPAQPHLQLLIVISSCLFGCIGAGLALHYYWAKPLTHALQQLPTSSPEDEHALGDNPWERLEHALGQHTPPHIKMALKELAVSLPSLQEALHHQQEASIVALVPLIKQLAPELQHISLSIAIEAARLYGNKVNSLQVIAEKMQEQADHLTSFLTHKNEAPERLLAEIDSMHKVIMALLTLLEQGHHSKQPLSPRTKI